MAETGSDPGTYGNAFGVQFQSQMLAVLARTPTYIIRYRSAIDPAFFSSDQHRLVAKILVEHSDSYRTLPSRATLIESVRALSTKESAPAAIKFVQSLYAKDVQDAESVKDKIVEFGKLQAAANATTLNSMDLDRGDRSKIIERMQAALIVGEDITDTGVDYGAATLEERASWYVEDKRACVPTGLTHLDQMLGGGPRRGDLNVVVAQTGKGKTTTLVNFLAGAVMLPTPTNAVYYTIGDLSREDIAARLDDRIAGLVFKFKKDDPQRYFRLMQDRVKRLVRGRCVIQYYPRRAVGMSRIRSHLAMLRAGGFSPDCIICDYASVLKPERRVGNVWEEIGAIYEELNGLAGEFNAVAWSGVQVPQRSYAKPILELGDIAGSAEIGEHAAIAITLNQTQQEEIENRGRYYGAKLRRKQGHGTVIAHIDRERCKITTQAWLNSAGTLVSGSYEGESTGGEALEEQSQRAALKSKVLPRRAPRNYVDPSDSQNGKQQRPEPKMYAAGARR